MGHLDVDRLVEPHPFHCPILCFGPKHNRSVPVRNCQHIWLGLIVSLCLLLLPSSVVDQRLRTISSAVELSHSHEKNSFWRSTGWGQSVLDLNILTYSLRRRRTFCFPSSGPTQSRTALE